MATIIVIAGERAELGDWEWSCARPELAIALNHRLEEIEVSGADPNPRLHEAMRMVELFGGELVEFDPTEPVKEGIVY